jgi:histidinol phosphatase-like enzyme
MIYYFDIDDTICTTEGLDYANAKPKLDIIKKINKLYDSGNQIIIWSSRGVGTGKNARRFTSTQRMGS